MSRITRFLMLSCLLLIPVRSTRLAQASNAVHDNQELSEFPWLPDAAEVGWRYLVIHHSATNSGSVESIHAAHRRRTDADGNPWLGIGYHFVIGNGQGMRDGEIRSTFRWQQQLHGAHSGHALFNSRGIGVCLIGNFEETQPTAAQLFSLRRLLVGLAERYAVPPERLMGHGDIRATKCPGQLFPLEVLRREMQHALPELSIQSGQRARRRKIVQGGNVLLPRLHAF